MDEEASSKNEQQWLGLRFADIDTLFNAFVYGILEDPDYALKKDRRIYERIERDPCVYSGIQVRALALAGRRWDMVPTEVGNERQVKLAKEVTQKVKRVRRWAECVRDMQDCLLRGLSVQEIQWKDSEYFGTKVPTQFHSVNKDRFVFDRLGKLRLRTRGNPVFGEPVPDFKFIPHTFNTSDGSWEAPEEAGYQYFGRGLADTLYHVFYFKMNALRFWLKYLERHGIPQKIMWHPPHAGAQADKIKTVLDNLQNSSVATIPGKKDEYEVEVIQHSSRATAGFEMFVENYCNRWITKVILGQELMTGVPSTGGNRALGDIQQNVFGWIINFDADCLQDTLQYTLIDYIRRLDYPQIPEEVFPKFRFRVMEPPDASSYLAAMQIMIENRVPCALEQAYELTGIRPPLTQETNILDLIDQQAIEQQAQQVREEKEQMQGAQEEQRAQGAQGAQGPQNVKIKAGGNGGGRPKPAQARGARR